MNLIGRAKRQNNADAFSREYNDGYAAGYSAAEKTFCDTIVFQDAYISSLERVIANLQGEMVANPVS